MWKEDYKQKHAEYMRIYLPRWRAKQQAIKETERIKKYDSLKSVPAIELAYIAGLFDGEGSISIVSPINLRRSAKPSYCLHISISQKRRMVLIYIMELFKLGGIYYDSKAKINSCWHSTSRDATEILKMLLPYLKIKKPQAELAIQFQGTMPNHCGRYHPLTEVQLTYRENIKKQIQKLNHTY